MLGTFRNWVEIVGRTLAVEGVNLGEELISRGVDLTRVDTAEGRLDPAASRAIWTVVDERSDDPVFVLSMLRHIDYLDFEELGVALVSSGSAEAVIGRIVRYHGLVSDRVAMTAEVGRHLLEVGLDHRATSWRAGEFSAALITSALRDRFDRSIAPEELHLGFTNPPGEHIYRRFFRCPVLLGAPATRLMFDRTVLARHALPGPHIVADRFERLLRSRAEHLERDRSVSVAVRSAIAESMGADPPTLERVAATLHVSPRTLQRQLRSEDTNFAALLDATRHELTRQWLSEGRLTRTEIAYLLGFSQPSSLSRALRRWDNDDAR
ncbi:MAG: AraC family transcriptional regulator [Solirubrobacteraceae bacterium]